MGITSFFISSDDTEPELKDLETFSSLFDFFVAFFEVLSASQRWVL